MFLRNRSAAPAGGAQPRPRDLPEKNPFVDKPTKKHGIPREVILGYVETLYPNYRSKLKR